MARTNTPDYVRTSIKEEEDGWRLVGKGSHKGHEFVVNHLFVDEQDAINERKHLEQVYRSTTRV